MSQDNRKKRDLHALNQDGMVLCNPSDREAAHRAEMEGIATEEHAAVTCKKCLDLLHKSTNNTEALRSIWDNADDAAYDGTDWKKAFLL